MGLVKLKDLKFYIWVQRTVIENLWRLVTEEVRRGKRGLGLGNLSIVICMYNPSTLLFFQVLLRVSHGRKKRHYDNCVRVRSCHIGTLSFVSRNLSSQFTLLLWIALRHRVPVRPTLLYPYVPRIPDGLESGHTRRHSLPCFMDGSFDTGPTTVDVKRTKGEDSLVIWTTTPRRWVPAG